MTETPEYYYKKWAKEPIYDSFKDDEIWNGNCVHGFVKFALQEYKRQIIDKIQKSSFIEHLTELQQRELEECFE